MAKTAIRFATAPADSADRFCRWLSMRSGKLYRSPTEEEWEYACLAGSKWGPFPWGDDTEVLSIKRCK